MNKEKLKYYMDNEEELPDMAYGVNEIEGTVIVIKKGERGYYPSTCDIRNLEQASAFAAGRNKILEVSEEMAEAMKLKSMFQWGRKEPEEEHDMEDRE